jgi:membrane protein YdbS with pleckstrin-like domain
MWQQYIQAFGKSVKDGYRTNAFAPMKWFAIFLVPILITSIATIKILFFQIIISILLSIIVVFSLVMYLVIFLKDPKLLQSEAFRIEDRKLDLIAQKGGDISINAVELNTGTNVLGDGTNGQ